MLSNSSVRWFQRQLLAWYDHFGRHDLPWKNPSTPYRIWVSEIMLQQTQVATVMDYFQRFMKSFPTLETLAAAPEDDLLAHWAGLGYYARARNLHRAAQIILKQFQGNLPENYEDLISLPGIGPSTAGAILAQAFHQRATILDGNVKRVLSRFRCVEGPIEDAQTLDNLWTLAETLTPQKRAADYTQAIMDLGATLCTRKNPACFDCPLHTQCQAYLTQRQTEFPQTTKKAKKPNKKAFFLGLTHRNHILLEKRPSPGIWGGLYSLPEFTELKSLKSWCKSQLEQPLDFDILGPKRHAFTHFHLEFKSYFLSCLTKPKLLKDSAARWISIKDLENIGLPAPIRRVLLEYL